MSVWIGPIVLRGSAVELSSPDSMTTNTRALRPHFLCILRFGYTVRAPIKRYRVGPYGCGFALRARA